MKENIKRLAVFVMIAASAMFVMTMASADDDKTIQGEYAIWGSAASLVAILGFNASLQPNGGALGPWLEGPNTWSGVLTFNKDGTGSFTGIFRAFEVYSSAIGAPPDGGSGNLSWGFTYIIDRGNITFTYVKGSFELDWTSGPNAPGKVYATITQPWDGVISSDGKIIALFWGPLILDLTSDKANTSPTGVQSMTQAALQGFKIE
ncbi:MAG TPA: hypothetical protein VEK32_12985 [Thermodesulfobacteriota bacterium]|nr:hypothetical protein [Thermodesulfobacteriota bacterium]